jgi:hypothetical protein
MKHFKKSFLLIILCLFLTLPVCSTDEVKLKEHTSLKGIQDSGTFYLSFKESILGTIKFNREISGEITSSGKISMAGQTIEFTVEIETDENGFWDKIEITEPRGKILLERDGLTVNRNLFGQKSTLEIKPESIFYMDNIPVLLSDIVKIYDHDKKGKQKLSLFIFPSAVRDVQIEFLNEEEKAVSGKDIRFRKYKVDFPGLATFLWTDEKNRIMLFDVPMQNAYFVREGYEVLRRKKLKILYYQNLNMK